MRDLRPRPIASSRAGAPERAVGRRAAIAQVLLTTGLLLVDAGCTCGNLVVDLPGSPAADGGSTGSPDGSTPVGAGKLFISPRDPLLEVVTGQPPTPLQFTATYDGAPIAAEWSFTPPELGTIDPSGKLSVSGAQPGTGTVTARHLSSSYSTGVTVRVREVQNGGGKESADAGSGGWGGVGGEGMGAAVSEPVLAVLRSGPVADSGLVMLYPYPATVWPRGILAPLLQWRPGTHAYEAVRIRAGCTAYLWEGTFAQTATPFLHHPIPQQAWQRLTTFCAGEQLTLQLIFASGPVAYGPITQTWRVAQGFLKGVVYYNSYGTKLARNYTGAIGGDGRFGGATLAIRGDSTDPVLVAGKDGAHAECRVCHVVSGDGSTLLSQRGDSYGATRAYALRSGNAESAMSPEDGRFAWGGLAPDGKVLFSNSAPLAGASSAPSALYAVPGGAPVASSGLPAGLRAGTPAFSADGTQVAFNWYGGTVDGGEGDGRSLAMMRFGPQATFTEFVKLFTPPAGQTAAYPSFLPGGGIVFEVQTLSNGRAFGESRSTCDGSGPCSNVGSRAELWWVDVASGKARPLERLNGKGYLPGDGADHDDDATLNYEPTVSPVGSGGYAWVIFTSRRLYGNVATINPFWSDPRYHDISQTPTPKKLWVAAIDLNPVPGTDPSHPAFYLPAQELIAGNSRGFWALDPCRADGESCVSGDQCCGGYCRGSSELNQVCSSTQSGCSREFEKCVADSDCCEVATGATCLNGRCTGSGLN